MCSHVTARLWHLGVRSGVIELYDYPLSAAQLLSAIDDSTQFTDEETHSDDETNPIPTDQHTTANNEHDNSSWWQAQ